MKAKKGDLWVSAVLYITLGVIAIALILSAAIAFITKLKDRNTVAQTKEVLVTLDETIRRVANEGPGSQRELSPFVIGAGKFFVHEQEDNITWEMETEAVIQEPNIDIKEGILTLHLRETKIEGRYLIVISAVYTNIDLNLTSSFNNPFTGKFSMLVRHSGRFPNGKPEIEIHLT